MNAISVKTVYGMKIYHKGAAQTIIVHQLAAMQMINVIGTFAMGVPMVRGLTAAEEELGMKITALV